MSVRTVFGVFRNGRFGEETYRVVAKLFTKLSHSLEIRFGGEANGVPSGKLGTRIDESGFGTIAQQRRVKRFRLDLVAGKARPVFRECLDEPGHSENGKNAFRRNTSEEVVGEVSDPWDQPGLILGFWRPEEDRVVTQRPVNTRQDEIEGGGIFGGVDCPDGQPESIGIFRNAVTRETQPAFDVRRSFQSTSCFLPQPLQGMGENNVGRSLLVLEMRMRGREEVGGGLMLGHGDQRRRGELARHVGVSCDMEDEAVSVKVVGNWDAG